MNRVTLEGHILDSVYSNFEADRIGQKLLDQIEDVPKFVLECLCNILQYGVKNEGSDFTMALNLRGATLVDNGQELRPVTKRELDRGDGSDNTGSRVSHEIARRS